MQIMIEQEGRREGFGGFNGHDQFQGALGDSMSFINEREQDVGRPKPSVLGDVRLITQKRVSDGRDIVEIEHTDGTETVLVFDRTS